MECIDRLRIAYHGRHAPERCHCDVFPLAGIQRAVSPWPGEWGGARHILPRCQTIIQHGGNSREATTDKAPFYFPGVSFLLGAVFMLLSIVISWYVLNREKKVVIEKTT